MKDFGAQGDDATDDYASIMAAYNAMPAGGGALYFPPGTYRFLTQLNFGRGIPLVLLGTGKFTSVLRPMMTSGDAIVFSGGSTTFFVASLGVDTSVARVNTDWILRVTAAAAGASEFACVSNGGGGLVFFDGCTFLEMSDCQGQSGISTSPGGTCLRIHGSSGLAVVNCIYRTGPFGSGSYTGAKPCLHVTGGAGTSMDFSNSNFMGGGPHSQWNISGIVSTPTTFTVTTSATHDFLAGDFLALRGASVAAYNQAFRIASVTATTIVVNSTLNPGVAAAQGTAESLAACALFSNEDGALNEGRCSNVLFEGGQTQKYGSVACYFDGRRGGANSPLSGWTLNGCYYDFGTVGLMLSGKPMSVSNDPSCFGFVVAGFKSEATRSSIHIEQAQGVAISGFGGNSNQLPTTDYICVDSSGTPASAELYLNSGGALPYTQGITVDGGNWGVQANWYPGHVARAKDYSLLTTDGGNIHELVVEGATLYGNIAPAIDDGTLGRWRLRNNIWHYGSIGSNEIPSVASAATVQLPYHDFVKITGSVAISTVGHAWIGRTVTLLVVSGLRLLPGGNLAITQPVPVAAGEHVSLIYDGTSWFPAPAFSPLTALASVSATPADPTGTTSATRVMMGLAVAFTPTLTGRVRATVDGSLTNTGAGGVTGIVLIYGTGTAPTNGAAETGTGVGAIGRASGNAANTQEPLSLTRNITGLTVGTAYWLDLSLSSSLGTSSLARLTASISEY